ncbi:MAG: hypothetical protein M1818_002861 [Claussenomyces sp. TS43310]|nr:MAG: hypothetical protein M1818_002861 [Claussenomyces sp. TS43310]
MSKHLKCWDPIDREANLSWLIFAIAKTDVTKVNPVSAWAEVLHLRERIRARDFPDAPPPYVDEVGHLTCDSGLAEGEETVFDALGSRSRSRRHEGRAESGSGPTDGGEGEGDRQTGMTEMERRRGKRTRRTVP